MLRDGQRVWWRCSSDGVGMGDLATAMTDLLCLGFGRAWAWNGFLMLPTAADSYYLLPLSLRDGLIFVIV